jgi:hypothetical protein
MRTENTRSPRPAQDPSKYQHRECLACGKRIPRWSKDGPTPKSIVFCDRACREYYRRLHPSKTAKSDNPHDTSSSDVLRPVKRALSTPLSRVHHLAQERLAGIGGGAFAELAAPPESKVKYGPCQTCGRAQPIVPGRPTYSVLS